MTATPSPMPRLPRLELSGVPMHVMQRGVNRCAIFIDDDDRDHFCHLLRGACRRHAITVHAYVLMDNHVHLLIAASAAGAVSRAMHALGHAYVQGFNARHRRCGPLWQGRFKSCLIDSDGYLLTLMRYIELNPVRAAMAGKAEAHRWSSVHAHLDRARDPLLESHPLYLALGADATARAAAWRRWLDAGVSVDDLAAIRRHLVQQRALGDPRFQHMVERALNRPVRCRPCGRPIGKSTDIDGAI